MTTSQKGRGRPAPPPRAVARRTIAGAVGGSIVCVCVIATVGSNRRDPSPRFPAPFAPTGAIAYDLDGQAVAVPAPRDRVLIYVSERCRYCRGELASWDALMRGRKGFPGPTLVLSPASTTGRPSWLPMRFRTGWLHDRDGAVAKALGVRGVPFTAVIDGDGIVREAWAGANPGPRRLRLLAMLTETVEKRP